MHEAAYRRRKIQACRQAYRRDKAEKVFFSDREGLYFSRKGVPEFRQAAAGVPAEPCRQEQPKNEGRLFRPEVLL